MASKQPTVSAAQKKQERQWQVESALSTLQRADQIRKDKGLMADVKKAASSIAQAVGCNAKAAPKKKK